VSEQLWLYDNGEGVQGPVGENAIVEMSRTGALSPDGSIREYGPGGAWMPLSRWSPGTIRPTAPAAVGAWTDTSPHPWRRYFARLLDYAIVGGVTWFLVGIIFYTLAPIDADNFFHAFSGPGGGILDMLCTVAAATPGTGLIVGLTGTSAGKWFFGIKVVDPDGKPIGVWRGLKREVTAWATGIGFGLPLVSLILCLVAYNRLQDERTTTWDKSVGAKVFHRPSGPMQTFLIFAGITLLITIRLLFMAAAEQN
jgi:uncharacterized RDD family membrane protein YckC